MATKFSDFQTASSPYAGLELVGLQGGSNVKVNASDITSITVLNTIELDGSDQFGIEFPFEEGMPGTVCWDVQIVSIDRFGVSSTDMTPQRFYQHVDWGSSSPTALSEMEDVYFIQLTGRASYVVDFDGSNDGFIFTQVLNVSNLAGTETIGLADQYTTIFLSQGGIMNVGWNLQAASETNLRIRGTVYRYNTFS